MEPVIRLFSIEDHWVFSRGLSFFRKDRDGLTLACSAETMEEALTKDPDQFDLILLDLMIPGTDPEDNMHKIKERFPEKPVIVLTSQENSAWEIKMFKAGIKAFLTKTTEKKVLVSTIREVYKGADYGPEKIEEEEKRRKQTDNIWESYLEPMEKEILKYFLEENTIKQIAAKTGNSQYNVYKKINRIRKKFKVNNNLALIKLFNNRLG